MKVADLLASAGINLAFAVGFFSLFSLLRKHPLNGRVYFTREYLKDRNYGKQLTYGLKTFVPTAGWLSRALGASDVEILKDSGLDSLVFLRLFRFSLKLFAAYLFIGFAILIPMNATDHFIDDHPDLGLGSLDKLSLANITLGSERLWAHCACTYIVTFLTFYLLFQESKVVNGLRLNHLAAARPQPDQFTVLVRQIPRVPGEPLTVTVDNFFHTNHPFTYLSHQLVYKGNKTLSLLNERSNLQNKLERLKRQIESEDHAKRHTIRTGLFGFLGEEVDALQWYRSELERLDVEIEEKQCVQREDDDQTIPSAFVNFNSRWGQAVCAQTLQSTDPTGWTTEWAPEPRDVCWANLGIPWVQLPLRSWIVFGLMFLTIFFYIIPVGFVQGLAELERLYKYLPFVKTLAEMPVLKTIIQGYLPSLALVIFIAVLPTLTMFLSKIEGHPSNSKLQLRSASKMFYFQIVNVFFANVLAGAIFNQLVDMVKEPAKIPTKLGAAIPSKAIFFITYIMVTGWAGFPSEILRLWPLILFHVQNVFIRHKTAWDKERIMGVQGPFYHQIIPGLLFFIFVGMVYVIVSPIVMPFLIVHFSLGYVVYKNQILNVYEPQYETGGMFWPFIFRRVIAALVIMQVTMIGVLGLKDAKVAAPLIIPLPFISVAFSSMCSARFFPCFVRLSIQSMRAKDLRDRLDGTTLDEDEVKTAYLHPSLFKSTREDTKWPPSCSQQGQSSSSSTDRWTSPNVRSQRKLLEHSSTSQRSSEVLGKQRLTDEGE